MSTLKATTLSVVFLVGGGAQATEHQGQREIRADAVGHLQTPSGVFRTDTLGHWRNEDGKAYKQNALGQWTDGDGRVFRKDSLGRYTDGDIVIEGSVIQNKQNTRRNN